MAILNSHNIQEFIKVLKDLELDTHIESAERRPLASKPVLDIIGDIIYHGLATNESVLLGASLKYNEEFLTRVVTAISSELRSKCSSVGTDLDAAVMEILKITKDYNWDSKAILALAAFVVTVGASWLVAQFHLPSPVTEGADLLKLLPNVSGATTSADANSKLELDALYALILETTDVTHKIFEFYELPLDEYFTFESPEIKSAISLIPPALYMIIRSIVISTTQFYSHRIESSTELSSLTSNINTEKGHITKLTEECKNCIEKTRDKCTLLAQTLRSPDVDNSKSLRILFEAPGLYDCYDRKQISSDHLKGTTVALLITDLDPDLHNEDEYAILQQMYLEKWHNPTSEESKYEVVWVPIPNEEWSEEKLNLFKDLRNQMVWHSVDDPSKVDKAVIKFAKDNWNIAAKPLLVVMDTKGNIVHKNAIYMMCIWGSMAYPFAAEAEDLLCREEMRWSIDLLIDNVELNTNTWILEGKHICLYGGQDEHWIRMFTNTVKEVANRAGIGLELLYMGRSKQKKKLANIIDIIDKENLSRKLDWNLIWYFWVRIESMLQVKTRTKSEDMENDHVFQGLRSLLGYDSKQQNWAVISNASGEMVMASGEVMRRGLIQLRKSKLLKESTTRFVSALDEHIRKSYPLVASDYTLPTTESRKEREAFKAIGRILESAHTQNSMSLDVLFHFKYGQRELYDCTNKKRVSNNDLGRKIIHLFITDIDPELQIIPEYKILKQMHAEKLKNRTKIENQFEVVWLPVVDLWDENKHKLFESLKGQMEWHSVHHPSVVSPVVVKYIKERWNFRKNPILVVMNNQGKIAHLNAIHIMCIWGSLAYPFTADREISLWDETSWSIDILVGNLTPNTATWLQEGRCICLYGGEDIEWIKKFASVVKDVAEESKILIQLLYVGRSKPSERTKEITEIILEEKLGSTLEWDQISYFWMRLESMQKSRGQVILEKNMKKDPVMQDITAMLTHGSSEEEWALISKRLTKMVKGTGENMLKGMAYHEWWRLREDDIGFLPALDEFLLEIQQDVSDDRKSDSWRLREDEIGFLPALDEFLLEIQQDVSDDRKKLTSDDEDVKILGRIFESSVNMTKTLEVLFRKKDAQPILYDCFEKRRISIGALRRKIVALFITDINPELQCGSEFIVLQQMFMEKRHSMSRAESQYEVIWVPVEDIWTEDKYTMFFKLREQMEWYSVHPSDVSPAANRFFKEKLNFAKKPMLVVMDAQGRIVHNNAIHMMCIWGSVAYPFTLNREKLLWDETCWSIDLVVDAIEPNVPVWIQEGRYICLYGGEDLEWIRKFTRTAKQVARVSGIVLELLYVGKRDPKESATRMIIDSIKRENLSLTLDWDLIWYFWIRIESMRLSKEQLTTFETLKNDPIMQLIISLLSYCSSNRDRGWALISRGYEEMVMGNGKIMLECLSEHENWRSREAEVGFVLALEYYLRQINLDAPHK